MPVIQPTAGRALLERQATGLIGELAVVITAGAEARSESATSLLTGYAGDAHTEWCEGRVAISAAGAADLVVASDLVVIAEGRIDNTGELAQTIGAPRGSSTSELLAHCWRRLGSAAIDRVVGEFAGVVVERATATAHAFRDICAGRPLHVSRVGDGWAVSSDWLPLVLARGERRRPDPEWFSAAFIGHSLKPTATPYVGVEIVLPGHSATPSTAGWSQTAQAEWDVPWLRERREGAYAEQFRALFDEAVRCRSAGESEVGFTLSGGLDSTSVLATAYAVAPLTARVAFCVPMVDPRGDERAMQAHMAARCQADLQWVDAAGLGPLGAHGPDAVFERFGAPPLSGNWYFGDAVAEQAARSGVRVLLDGEDGDGCVGGSKTFLADLLTTGRWMAWLREVNISRARGSGSGQEMLRDSLYLSAPPKWRKAYLRRRRSELAPPVLPAALRAQLDLDERMRSGFLNEAWCLGRAFRQAQAQVGTARYLSPMMTSMCEPWRRRGILLTHPWADRRLMSFCMGLPYEHVRKHSVPKVILRQAMAARLPPELVAHNGKADLSEVANRAARGHEREYLMEGLRLAREQPDWFDAGEVAEIQREFESGGAVSPASRVAMFAWWLRWCEAS